MAPLTLKGAYDSLRKGEVAPAYCLSGPVDLLKSELADAIVEAAVPPETRDFNLDVRSATDLDGEALHTLVETPPMLAERRAVVVRGIDQWRKNAKIWDVLARYLAHASPTTVLVLIQNGGDPPDPRATRGTVHVVADSLRPDAAAAWLRRRATTVGMELTPEAADHLLAVLGEDLGTLAQELEKLAVATVGDEPVTADHVSALVGVRRGETVTDWVRAVIRRDQPRAIELLEVVRRQPSLTGVQLVMALGTALVGVRLARALAEAGTPWSRLRSSLFARLRAIRPRGVGRYSDEASAWAEAARQWSTAELDAAIAAAGNADRLLKSTTISDERGVLLSMLLALPRPRVAA